MEQFTASEVVTKLRERFASGNDVPVPDVRLTRAEFDVIADLLEAREIARLEGLNSRLMQSGTTQFCLEKFWGNPTCR